MSKEEKNLSKYTLEKVPGFLELQAPSFIEYCEKKYYYGWEEKPTQMFKKFDKLERRVQIGLVGWVYTATKRMIKDHPEPGGFYFIMGYMNLGTVLCLERTIKNEVDNKPNEQERQYFEECCHWVEKC